MCTIVTADDPMTYTVSTIINTERGIETAAIGTFADKVEAMTAAKRAARTRRDCQIYGPSSLCYVGRDITAVVAWST
jgi:hypothetical protein